MRFLREESDLELEECIKVDQVKKDGRSIPEGTAEAKTQRCEPEGYV